MPIDMTGNSSRGSGSSGLVDILDRVLDKGLVVAGDMVRLSLVGIDPITVEARAFLTPGPGPMGK